MVSYYNEIDSYAAQWLRNLIEAGHIAAGDVDERSIVDVQPTDLARYDQCHFFAGIGGWSYALRLAGWPDSRPVWTGSCPCQPFSSAGKGKAADDERHLWPAWASLIAECRPGTVFGEQVEAAIGWGWLDTVFNDLEAEGYACGAAVLPACGVGAPHIRQRLWWVADRDEGGRSVEWGLRLQRQQIHDVDGCGADGRMAESQGEQSHGRRDTGRGRGKPADVGRMVHASSEQVGLPGCARQSGSAAGELGDVRSQGSRRHARAVFSAQGEGPRERSGVGVTDEPVAASAVGELGDATIKGRKGFSHGRHTLPAQRAPLERAGGDAGFWSAVDWLPCRDGKARPVEPGTFPLAHGIPGRVGRLRAYGNAIVPQVAAEFIAAFCDVRAAA